MRSSWATQPPFTETWRFNLALNENQEGSVPGGDFFPSAALLPVEVQRPQDAVGCFFFFQLCICFGFCLPDLRLMPPLFESRHGKGIDCSGVRGEYQSWCCWGDSNAPTAAGTSCPARTSPGKAEQSKNIRVRRKKRAVRLLIALGDGPGWCLGGSMAMDAGVHQRALGSRPRSCWLGVSRFVLPYS